MFKEAPSRPEKRAWSLSEAAKIQAEAYASLATSKHPAVQTLVDWSSRLSTERLIATPERRPNIAPTETHAEPLAAEALAGSWWQTLVPDHVYRDEQGHYYFIIERPAHHTEGYEDRREGARVQAEAFLRERIAERPGTKLRLRIVCSHHLQGSSHVFHLIRTYEQKEPT